jgi:hypothetical protein
MFDFDVVTGPMPDPRTGRGEKREPKPGDPSERVAPGDAARGEGGIAGAQGRPGDRHLE